MKKHYLLLTAFLLLSAIILYGSDWLLIHWLGLENKFPRHLLSGVTNGFVVLSLIYFSFSWKAYFFWMSLFLFFSFLQWLCLSYYGNYLSPMMIFLFFREVGEVLETFQKVLETLIKPTLIWLGSMGCLYGLFIWSRSFRGESTLGLKSAAFRGQGILQKSLKGLLLFSLFYPAPRAYFAGHTFGKQAVIHEASFVNFYGSLVYFAGRILPHKLWAKNKTPVDLSVPKVKEVRPQRHVIFILGESLGLRHMEIFGYELKTTPYWSELKNQGKLLLRRGISGGVSTDVSIPMLIHGSHGDGASAAIAALDRCLFKLAKQNGFTTHFLSIQTEDNLRHIANYLCPAYVDQFKVGSDEQMVNGESTVLDEELIPLVQAVDWSKPQFVVFHQRGSHAPYDMRYRPEKAAWPVTAELDFAQAQIRHYDNSVAYTDEVLNQLIAKVREQSKLPVEVVFTSDHGEALGENQHWGHVILEPVVAEVPILYLPAFSGSQNFIDLFESSPEWTSHQFFSNFLYHLLGYDFEPVQEDFLVMGADLDGLGEFMVVQPEGQQLIKKTGEANSTAAMEK